MLIAALLSVFAVTAQAEDQISGAYMYRVSGGKAIITSFDNSQSGALIIPDRLRGYAVTEIDDSVFYDTVLSFQLHIQ